MERRDKRTLKLPEKHGGHARPGHKISVADRPDFPGDRVVPDSNSEQRSSTR